MSKNTMIATELDGRVDFTFDAIIVEAEAPGSNNFNQYLDELSRRIAEFAQNRSNIHNALDLLGYAPGVGSFADLANAGLYLYEGNYKESLYSGLAAAPGMGDAFAAARTAKRVENAVQGLSKAETELHHIATDKSKKFDFKNHPAFKETGIDVSKDIDNLVELAGHRGRHTNAYHQEVQRRLDAVYERFGGTDKLESAVRNELNIMRKELLEGTLNLYGK